MRRSLLDALKKEDNIEISIEYYVKSLEDITDIQKADIDETLTKWELKEYRKMTGKIAWLTNSTRPDISFTSLQLARRNKCATISDLRYCNTVLKKVGEKESRICFAKIGKREDLKIIGISDTSYKSDDKSVGGVFLFLANDKMTSASSLYWKSKHIKLFPIHPMTLKL